MVAPLVANFEQGFYMLWEMPSEDWVGLGFGLSVLLAISTIAGFRRKVRVPLASFRGMCDLRGCSRMRSRAGCRQGCESS